MINNKTSGDDFQCDEDRIEIALRILGNEIIGFQIHSFSKKKNIFVTSAILLILVTLLLSQLVPLIQILI